ncbi:MAG: hypothetical protein IT427_09915 [Pirellulales bacterium]|nr:hypothetical protein [Pirellulales bacterium]
MRKPFRCLVIVAWLIVCASVGRPIFAQTAAPAEPPKFANASTIDFQSLLQRLDQQESEIRALREQLGAIQPNSQFFSSALQDSHGTMALPSGQLSGLDGDRTLRGFHERLTSLENLLAEQSARQMAATGSGPVPYEVGADLSMTASWKNGVELASKNKDYRVHIGGRTQFDISGFNNDPDLTVSPTVGGIGVQPNSAQMRRARLRIDGAMYENFEWVVEYDFVTTLAPASPTVGAPAVAVPAIADAYLAWTDLPGVGTFRAGNLKEPIGMEHVQSSRWLDFIERSYLQDTIFGPFNNGFNPGMLFFNDWGDERGTWWIGAFSNNSNPFGYGIGDDWAVTGRVTWLPYFDEPSDGRYLWHLGMSASVRHPDEGEVRLRARGDIRSGPPGVLNPIYADTGTMEASQQELLAFENAAVWGPWTLQAEYVGTWIESAVKPIAPPAARVLHGTPFYHGGYVQLLYFLTGEHRAYNHHYAVFDRVVPYTNLFFVDGAGGHCYGWGAWQIGARYNAIDLNDNGIDGGVLQSGTFTVNWWLNPNSHVQFNYDLTHRNQVKETPAGFINSFGVRFAYDF